MNHKFDSVNGSSFEDSHSVVAKLRRLKIQESLFWKTVNKLIQKENESEVDLPILYSSEFKQFSKKLKDSFTEINIKFEDIKAEAEEKLSCLDIETMKKDVIKLDDKIRTFKNFIHTELASEISKVEQLTKAINSVEEKQPRCIMKTKSRSKLFNHIVPSPVKVLIKSPFKCKEVQDLQEFMMNSPNRYGGWNEYNHNIFVQIWQKHFNADVIRVVFDIDVAVDNNVEAFQKEALHKIVGSTKDDIISHQKWYSKYLYLKEEQQNALNKWRRNQRLLTKTNDKKHHEDQKTMNGNKLFSPNSVPTMKNMDGYTSEVVPLSPSHDLMMGSQGNRGQPSNFTDFLNTVESNGTTEIASALCNMSFENEDLAFHSETDMNCVTTNSLAGNTIGAKRSYGGILKPTKQWTNRCNSMRDSLKTYNDIENISKLRIPDWRLTLQD